jgi:CheY-like chemotaxis protein
MKKNFPGKNGSNIHIVLVDDDEDDHFIFSTILDEIKIPTQLTSITESEEIVDHLLSLPHLPDIIFLDFNMPRKNGYDCLIEIKACEDLKRIPVIIYSTSYKKDILDMLYDQGAVFSIRKSSSSNETKKCIETALELAIEKEMVLQPARKEFTLGFRE